MVLFLEFDDNNTFEKAAIFKSKIGLLRRIYGLYKVIFVNYKCSRMLKFFSISPVFHRNQPKSFVHCQYVSLDQTIHFMFPKEKLPLLKEIVKITYFWLTQKNTVGYIIIISNFFTTRFDSIHSWH